jgi:ketosteroid isomerase-like protein
MSNLEVVQELYRAFREKDYDAFRKISTPDIEWIQNEGFPRGSNRRGADAVIDNAVRSASRKRSRELVDYPPQGDN